MTFRPVWFPPDVRSAEKVRLVVESRLKPGWHIYSVIRSEDPDAPPPTRLDVHTGLLTEDGPVYETPPESEFIPVLGMKIDYHSELAFFYQNLQVVRGAAPASRSLAADLTYQLCTASICLPPKTETFTVAYRIDPGEARAAFLHPDRTINTLPGKGDGNVLAEFQASGFWAFIALAALMGLVSLLTPCVFPMIPITVTYFSKQAEGKQSRVIKLATLFALGIIFTYTAVGLLLSGLFGAGSALLLASNPIINLIIGLVFILFALSLMGLFEISLPAGLESFFDRKSRSLGGMAGVLLMGFTFTLTAFTCTVQFVGTMLIAAAQGEWIWPLLGMLVFSTVFSLPFFLLAIAPSLVRQIQGRSGAWLGRSKTVLGILEMMASIKFLSNADLVWQTELLPRNTAIGIWTVLLLAIVIYLIWTGIRPVLNRSPIQWAAVAFFLSLTILVSRGWNDRSLGSLVDSVLPPASGLHQTAGETVSAEEIRQLQWLDSYSEALKLAQRDNRPLLLEFTGYTCVNCRWMEQNILARKKIHYQIRDGFIPVRLYTDGGKNAQKNLDFQIDRFQTVALPFYAILSPDGRLIRKQNGITLNPKAFEQFLTFNKTE
ncbi:MAG: cytochrome c biogenesis protein CcdA [bacterium]